MCCMPSLMYMLCVFGRGRRPRGASWKEIKLDYIVWYFIFSLSPTRFSRWCFGSGAHGSALIVDRSPPPGFKSCSQGCGELVYDPF